MLHFTKILVFNDTLFPVLYQCALEQDLEMFEAGDQTEVGERGLTLRYYTNPKLTLRRQADSFVVVVRRHD